MREIDSKTQRRLRNGEEWGKERERDFKNRGEPNEATQDVRDGKLTQRDSRLEQPFRALAGKWPLHHPTPQDLPVQHRDDISCWRAPSFFFSQSPKPLKGERGGEEETGRQANGG